MAAHTPWNALLYLNLQWIEKSNDMVKSIKKGLKMREKNIAKESTHEGVGP